MTTLYLSHPAFLNHETPLGHPERPDRIRVVERILEGEAFQSLVREQAPLAPMERALLAHRGDYVDMLDTARPREGGGVRLDADTVMSVGTWEAVLRGMGASIQAVEEVMQGKVQNAFCGIRPPGHHAESVRAMGFCLFNNAAVAARYAQRELGAERVAIVDFDVHHGNGTQEIFWDDDSVLYASTHQMPLYPGTGAATETGVGNIFNAPMSAGEGGDVFREAFDVVILPALERFSPDLLIISAGFDAHRRDPLGGLMLVEEDFSWATRKMMEVADRHCGGRVVSLLEGGYDLEGLARSVAAHVTTLMRG